MTWNFNIESAPRGYMDTEERHDRKDGLRLVEVYRYVPVILETKCGKVVKSRWLPPAKDRKVGRWEMLATDELPVAWQPWPEPSGGVR